MRISRRKAPSMKAARWVALYRRLRRFSLRGRGNITSGAPMPLDPTFISHSSTLGYPMRYTSILTHPYGSSKCTGGASLLALLPRTSHPPAAFERAASPGTGGLIGRRLLQHLGGRLDRPIPRVGP